MFFFFVFFPYWGDFVRYARFRAVCPISCGMPGKSMRVVLTFRKITKKKKTCVFFRFFSCTGTISCGMPESRAVCPNLVRYAWKKYACGSNFLKNNAKKKRLVFFFVFFRVLGRFGAVCPDFVRYARKKYACGSNFSKNNAKKKTCVFFRFFFVYWDDFVRYARIWCGMPGKSMRVVLTFSKNSEKKKTCVFFRFFFRTGTISCGMPESRAVCPDLVRYAQISCGMPGKSMRVVLTFRKITQKKRLVFFFVFFRVLGRFFRAFSSLYTWPLPSTRHTVIPR